MVIRNNSVPLKTALGFGLFFSVAAATCGIAALAQAPAVATAPATVTSQRGTVKTVSGDTLTMATDAGPVVTVSVASGAKIVQLAVGSVDLKTAKPSQLTDISVGDRVLVIGRAGDAPGSFNALRVILMKSADIAQMQAAQQADWKARGVGGIVSAVDPASGTVTLAVGSKKLVVDTSSKTVFRRFTGDSVKYEDAKPGTFAQIHPKDQLQARGTKSADGASMQAEEVVSGAFENLSGLVAGIDPAARTITLKDLMTHKVFTVNVTTNSNIRTLPPYIATRMAARTNGGGGRAGGAGAGADGARRSAGMDLSQMIGSLPSMTLADLKNGDAVMIVASEPSPGSSTVTAITLLAGVEPILTANPNGGMNLSMSIGDAPSGGE